MRVAKTKRVSKRLDRREMLRQVAAFKRQHGHCRIPANYAGNPQLGRWVAARRYARKVGTLREAEVRELDRLGFLWSPADEAWDRMFAELCEFAEKRGHCCVSRCVSANETLVNWVQNQRHRKKAGKLSRERVQKLESVGFVWSVHGQPAAEDAESLVSRETGRERLYVLGNGTYLQYGGKGRLPPRLGKFVRDHHGEFPPYIPLPGTPTVFHLGERYVRERQRKWKGSGAVPDEVLDYVRENGVLPPHD
jgi:hypothetical protein